MRINPKCRVIGVSVHLDGPCLSRMMGAGPAGYLTKGCDIEEMVRAIRQVDRGHRSIGTDVAQHMVLHNMDGERTALESLSPRELEVMLLGESRAQAQTHIGLAVFESQDNQHLQDPRNVQAGHHD